MIYQFAFFILAAVLVPVMAAEDMNAPTRNKVHAGFSYGAFWPKDDSPKTYEDFLRLFNQAKNLPGASVSFNSARLFQAGQWQKPSEPSEAFKAAIIAR